MGRHLPFFLDRRKPMILEHGDPTQEHESEESRTALRLGCPLIQTERLLLRPPHESDVDDIAELANNYRVAQMLGSMPHPYFREDAREFITKISNSRNGQCVYAITDKKTGRFMGVSGLHEDHQRYELPFIGYWLGEPYWGSGYATEAARAMVALFFKVTDREEMLISCRRDNAGSRRVIEKCGGVYWRDGREYNKALGEWHMLEHYRVSRSSWSEAA